jgi:hypothetical protein
MEAWAGSSLNKRGVRRTRLPSGVGLLLVITLKKGRTKRPGQKVVYMSDLSTLNAVYGRYESRNSVAIGRWKRDDAKERWRAG